MRRIDVVEGLGKQAGGGGAEEGQAAEQAHSKVGRSRKRRPKGRHFDVFTEFGGYFFPDLALELIFQKRSPPQ